jgi:hypothetical protein
VCATTAIAKKAIVMEHIMQVSDVIHILQHWTTIKNGIDSSFVKFMRRIGPVSQMRTQ